MTMASGAQNRTVRHEAAAKAISKAIIRNMPADDGGSGCPVLVEGIRDEQALRSLGFRGTIEKVNRGWDRPRLIAYLHSTYCSEQAAAGGPPIILLMDWDRTGGRLQTVLREQLMAMDMPVDEELRTVLLRVMKPESRTIEALAPHSRHLNPLIEEYLDDPE